MPQRSWIGVAVALALGSTLLADPPARAVPKGPPTDAGVRAPDDALPPGPRRPLPLVPVEQPPDPPRRLPLDAAFYAAPLVTPGAPRPLLVPVSATEPALPERPKPTPPAPLPLAPVQAAPAMPGLFITIEAPARISQGQALPCRMVVHNLGPAVAGVRIELPLPGDTRLVHASPSAERGEGGVVWVLGDLPAGAVRPLSADLLPARAEDLPLCPRATFAVAVGARTAVVRPPLSVEVSGPELATVGENVPFTVRVRNNTRDRMRQVIVSCRLPAGLAHPQGQLITTELPGDLAPGEQRTVDLLARAEVPGRMALHLDTRAAGGLTAEAQGVVEVRQPAVAVRVEGPRHGRVGEELTVKLFVANPARSATVSLRLLLPLPEGVELVSASDGGTVYPGTTCVTWTPGSLAADQTLALSVKLRGAMPGEWALAGVATGEGMREVRHTHAVNIKARP